MNYLNKINSPADVKSLTLAQLEELAQEMREALIKKLSIHGGHFGPNLGMVEAIIALHRVFDSPVDKFVFDVSHQSYAHKMLTGRAAAFIDENKYDDVSGYTNPEESPHDFFNVGHTSTSISLASGLAKGRDLTGGSGNVIAVIGDGSLSGGEALEGLDTAGEMKSNFIIVVNDNQMSIAENHGGMYKNLELLRNTKGQAECNLFKSMGLDYMYVQDGNSIDALITAFEKVKDIDHPIVVHIVTLKGKGYKPAETNKESWHWCMPFDIETGKGKYDFSNAEDYGALTAEFMLNKMQQDKSVVMLTAGTPAVNGFTKENRDKAGSQFVDVGIAEEQEMAMASGIAVNGGKPVVGIYSTFMQRTYDQISQDICINKSPVTILVNAASIYGMNDVTHLGIYDIPMISNIPNLVYLAPATCEEYFAMLDWSIEQRDYPVAIRVPGNRVIHTDKEVKKDYSALNKYQVVKNGEQVAILALGSFFEIGEKAVEMLAAKGVNATLINPVYITGIDTDLLANLKQNHKLLVTLEDGILDGGFGEKICRYYSLSDTKVLNYGFKKEFLDRYDFNEILKENRITPEQITEDILKILG